MRYRFLSIAELDQIGRHPYLSPSLALPGGLGDTPQFWPFTRLGATNRLTTGPGSLPLFRLAGGRLGCVSRRWLDLQLGHPLHEVRQQDVPPADLLLASGCSRGWGTSGGWWCATIGGRRTTWGSYRWAA